MANMKQSAKKDFIYERLLFYVHRPLTVVSFCGIYAHIQSFCIYIIGASKNVKRQIMKNYYFLHLQKETHEKNRVGGPALKKYNLCHLLEFS